MYEKIIIASHHKMAEGLKDTLNYITGGHGNVHALSAYLNNTSIQEEIDELLKDIKEEDEVLVFTDLLGDQSTKHSSHIFPMRIFM